MSNSQSDAPIQIPNKDLFLPHEIIPIFKVSRATVYRMIEDGSLMSIRVRKNLRVPRQSVVAYASRNFGA